MTENMTDIWQEYHDRLSRFIQSRVDDENAVQDIVQDVFLRIQTRIGTLKEDSKLTSWIYQIARNSIIDYYRARRAMVPLPDALPAPEPELLSRAQEDIATCFVPMIERLPDTYREAVDLSEIKGLPQKEVARIQGISLVAAKARIRRGRGMLRQMLFNCCEFEFDTQGNIIDYQRKHSDCACDVCGGDSAGKPEPSECSPTPEDER